MSTEPTNLGGSRLFADMAPSEVDVVLSACERRVVPGGQMLQSEGDPGGSLCLVRSGRVEIFKVIRGDVDRVLETVGPGDVIGVMSFLDGSQQPAGARATEPSELAVLSEAAFERIRRERPDVAAPFYRNLASILASRLRTLLEVYREAVVFGIEATGASAFALKSIVEELRPTTVHLLGGTSLSGRLLQLDQNAAGFTLVLKEPSGNLTIIPYHAIQRIEMA